MDFEDVDQLQAAAQRVRAGYLKVVTSTSISDSQRPSLRDDPVRGKLWVSKFQTPKPTSDTSRKLLLCLIDELNEHNVQYAQPDSQNLSFEWVGYRHDAKSDTPEPPTLSEQGKFKKLSEETTSPLAILYIYGGTFALNTPSCYRKTSALLAKSTGAKVLMVHQRLAPQNPFPAALLDVFQAYLTLLAPPPGSVHTTVQPSQVVLAGDSSGSCLALGLLQILLRLQRANKTITFHNQTLNPQLPAGITIVSPIADLTSSLPSFTKNAKSDIFLLPTDTLPYLREDFPTCSVWPTSPPRANLYCEAVMLAHPLASPAGSDDWSGCCPMWMASGQEMSIDGALLITEVATKQGVSVTLQEYEGMPHTFFFLFRDAPQSQKVMRDWVEAILRFGKGEKPEPSAAFVRAKGLKSEFRDLTTPLVGVTVSEARKGMWEATKRHRIPEDQRIGSGKASL